MTEAEEDEIGDTLWRAIHFHRSGRGGLSQKTAFIFRGLSEGHLSNEYPWILNDGFIAASRASDLRYLRAIPILFGRFQVKRKRLSR